MRKWLLCLLIPLLLLTSCSGGSIYRFEGNFSITEMEDGYRIQIDGNVIEWEPTPTPTPTLTPTPTPTPNGGVMAWYDSNWGWRREKTIDGDDAVNGFQLCFLWLHQGAGACDDDNIYFDNKCKDYFDDIRVTDSDGTTLLPFFIRDEAQTTGELCVLVDVPATPGTATIYIYYGNSAATRASDPYAVFEHAELSPIMDQIDTENNIPAKADRLYDSFPQICRASDGTIILGYGKAILHAWNVNNYSVYKISTDGGRTRDFGISSNLSNNAAAAQPDVILDSVTGFAPYQLVLLHDDDSDELCEIESIAGTTLTMTANLVNAYTEADPATCTVDAVVIRPAITPNAGWYVGLVGIHEIDIGGTPYIIINWNYSNDGATWRVYTSRSTLDNIVAGAPSWTAPVEVENAGRTSYNPPITMSNGNLLLASVDTTASPVENYVNMSNDNGDTWAAEVLVTNHANDYTEGTLVELKDSGAYNDDIYCLMRKDGGASPFEMGCCVSPDYGATWGAVAGSGVTQINDRSDKPHIIRASDDAIYLVYAYRGGADDGELYVIKASSESAAGITWDTTNYALPWQCQDGDLAFANYAYPSICEVENGGQLGVTYYLKQDAADVDSYIYFSFVELNSFVGTEHSRVQGGGVVQWVTTGGCTSFFEAVAIQAGAMMMVNTAETDFIVEWKARAEATGDLNALRVTDGAMGPYFSIMLFPWSANPGDVSYSEAGVLRQLWDSFVKGVTYIYRIQVDEGTPAVKHAVYTPGQPWTEEAADVAWKNIPTGAPVHTDRLYISSVLATADAYFDWWWYTTRKRTADPPTWGTTGPERDEAWAPGGSGSLSQAAKVLLE